MKRLQPIPFIQQFARPAAFSTLALLLCASPAFAQGGFGGGGGAGSVGGGGMGGGFPGGGNGGDSRSEFEPRSVHSEAVLNDPRFASLRKLVDLDLKDASLREVAQSLAKASGVSIQVDDKVPATARITMQANRVPLADVLNAVAGQAEVAIDPIGAATGHSAGVLLRPWPRLLVSNGSSLTTGEYYQTGNAPWSDKWKAQVADGRQTILDGSGHAITIPPDKEAVVLANGTVKFFPKNSAGGFGGGGGMGAGGVGAANSIQGNVTGFGGGLGGRAGGGVGSGGFGGGGEFGGSGAGMSSIAPLGNGMIAVAEPGVGPKGELGLTLTAYRFENGAFKNMGSTFHRFGAAQPASIKSTGKGAKAAVSASNARTWARSVEKRAENVKPENLYFQTEINGSRNVIYRLHLPDGSAQYIKEKCGAPNVSGSQPASH